MHISDPLVEEIRLLHELPDGHNDTTHSSIADPSADDATDDGINNLPSEFSPKWILWVCVGLLAAYLLYKVHRFLLRRARILRSEVAMDHLGDLQMLPSEDFSDPDFQDEPEEKDNDDLL